MSTKEARFYSVQELLRRATEVRAHLFGEARAPLLPGKRDDSIHCIVLYYREGTPGQEIVYPPHFIVRVDAATGDVVESRAVVPRDLGVSQEPRAPTKGFGLDPDMTGSEYRASKDRFMEISSPVWEIYATGVTTLHGQDADLVREYDTIYRRIAKAPLIPYYEAVAPDFFEWLGTVLAQ